MNPTKNNSKYFLKTFLVFIFIVSFLICFSKNSISEKLFIDGTVSGYYYNTANVVSKKDRQIKLEGILEGVTIEVLKNEKTVFSTKTNSKKLN